VHQNFAGLALELRYYLVRLRYGPLMPWIGAAIGPGYSDLNIGRVRILPGAVRLMTPDAETPRIPPEVVSVAPV
jgi:hypothetical protein